MTPRQDTPAPAGLRFVASLALAALAATLLIAYLLWTARQDAVNIAQTTALNYARTMEVRLEATFRRADAVLQALAMTLPVEALATGAEGQHAASINAELAANLRQFEELLALRVIDLRGDQRYVAVGVNAVGTGATAFNYADRSFYRRYQSDPWAGLLFSEVVMGRASSRPTVVITRPIRDRDGRFVGAVLAPLDLSFFQAQFRKLDIGANGAVFLRRSDSAGRMVLRWPHIEAEVNSPMPESHVIWQSVLAGKAEALNEYVAFTDGVPRLSGTVIVKSYPFFLTVAVSKADALASWRRVAAVTGGAWLALLAAMAVLVWRLRGSDRERLSLEKQLQEARRIESLGTLAGGIAHDFNNILAAIIGNVALARRDLGPSHPALASLEQVYKASTRGRDLVQQILAIGRRQPRALANQPLQPLIDETLSLLRPTLPPGLRLTAAAAGRPVLARVDTTQFQQVLINLCTNAVHAMRGRSGQIDVGVEALDVADRSARDSHDLPTGRYAHLWVRDQGIGMDAATRARIFEPFFTTKASGEGSGLGLPVVQGIVAAHRGEISVDSEPGQGTTVHLYLPQSDDETAEASVPRYLPITTPGSPSGAGQRVLYVDDDEVVALMVEQLLKQAGFNATVVPGGAQALALLEADRQAFDIVVTDFNMPGMSGLDLVRELAAQRSSLPVVISSGYITEELTQAAEAAGVRGLVQKQNTLEELVPLLHAVLGSAAGPRPAA